MKTRRGKPLPRDYGAIIEGYCRDVSSGAILACKWVRLAVDRHLRDLQDPDLPYRWEPETAADFLAGVERFHHVKGRWARDREPIRLEPWQCFVLGVPFGWLRLDDGLRRFREVYIEIPRKNGKSLMAALVGLHMAFCDREAGSEVYCGANTERQAHEVFIPAKLMLDRSPEIREEFGGIEILQKSMVRPDDYSRFVPVVGRPGDGASPSCAIVDEFHEHDTSDLIDSMVSGMGAREQPILLIITTAGSNLASPCRDKHSEVKKVLEGAVDNDELFGAIYTVDEGDDWTSLEAIRKANPNLGVSVDEGFLISQQRQAVANAAYQNRFRTKHLCEWCAASVAGINMAHWNAAADPTLRLEQFAGESAIFALDLAGRIDIMAFNQLVARTIDGVRHWYLFGRYYLPEESIANARDNALAYQKWVRDGHLIATSGSENDFDSLRDDVIKMSSILKAERIVFDKWRATHLSHQLMAEGANMVEFPQAGGAMAMGYDELCAALASGRFHHDGNPVLTWMASNTFAKVIAKGLVIPAKEHPNSPRKIDGIVCLCMALSQAVSGVLTEQQEYEQGLSSWLANPV